MIFHYLISPKFKGILSQQEKENNLLKEEKNEFKNCDKVEGT